MEKYSQLTTW